MTFDSRPVSTAIAIDKDKNSHVAVKWAIENILKKSDSVFLIHVRTQTLAPQDAVPKGGRPPTEAELQQFFLPYRGFCARKGVRAREVILHDIDVSTALVDFIHRNSICTIVSGATNRSALTRAFRNTDVPTSLSKTAPEFCTVYVIAKGKVQSIRSASRPPTPSNAANSKQQSQTGFSANSSASGYINQNFSQGSWSSGGSERRSLDKSSDSMQKTLHAKLTRGVICAPQHAMGDLHLLGVPRSGPSSVSDLSDSSGPPSFQSADISYDHLDDSLTSSSSTSSSSSQISRDIDAEMRRLKLELKQTMEMYNSACKEAVSAKQKARDISQWKSLEARNIKEARKAREIALSVADMEKQKSRAAMEAAQVAQKLAELEIQKRENAERKATHEEEERNRMMDALSRKDIRYRKYTIEEIEIATDHFSKSLKVGEGGYGPVYKAFLDHTAVAIKVLKPNMSQGQKQFQREVEVLSSMRHPHMVLLVGACPEYGCLVYEYMENGSLEDRLFRRNNTPPIPWRIRFKIAAEIATALLFMHQAKPEPLVHRDLKPANILLDRNYGSKISDVGLARLVPPSVADSVTQYHMTSAAGTFCYIDPEYQQTGMLSVQSDIYSLGIVLLQIITAKPAIGLAHHVEMSIEDGTFSEMLDPTVTDWPFEEVLSYAILALQCCELRRKNRPDLSSVIVPELKRLRDLGLHNGAGSQAEIIYGVSTFSFPESMNNSGSHSGSQWRSEESGSSSSSRLGNGV